MERCTANAKGSQEQCKNYVVHGRSKCRLHGGATPRGVASPHFKHGRYSQDLPTKISVSMQKGQLPLDLLQSHDELALCDSRIQELTKQFVFVDKGEYSGLWQDILKVMDMRRRLVETELKHTKISAHWIPIKQAFALVGRITYLIKQQLDLHVNPESGKRVCLGLQQELSKTWTHEERYFQG